MSDTGIWSALSADEAEEKSSFSVAPETSLTIDDVFGNEGRIAKVMPGFNARRGQIEMVRHIERALAAEECEVVEAPTGTGKSLAYLYSTIEYARKNNMRVLIATANKSLQDQLVRKDLPFVRDHVFSGEGNPLRFAIAKGRANFFCLNQKAALAKLERDTNHLEDRSAIESLRSWAETTGTGDLAEFPGVASLPYRVRSLATVSSEECIGKQKCPSGGACFAESARRTAANSHVVVANYHLLFAHLKVFAISGIEAVLPHFDILVLDEAHKAPEISREFFGRTVSFSRFRKFATEAIGIDGSIKGDLIRSADLFFLEMEKIIDSLSPFYSGTAELFLRPEAQRLSSSLFSAVEAVEAAQAQEALASSEAGAKYEPTLKRANSLKQDLQLILAASNDQYVYYGEKKVLPNGVFVKLGAKPITTAPWLRRYLWDQTHSVVATSATLSVGGDFDFFLEDMGFDRSRTATHVVTSPFNYRKQCALVVDSEAPDPKDLEAHAYWCARRIVQIVQASKGRALCLFTAQKNMLSTQAELLRAKLPYQILMQEMGNPAANAQLIEEFKKDRSSVLLGLESFWAGVDVPGEALSVVTIDRLPFAHPESDPLLSAIKERAGFSSCFNRYMIPKSVLTLKQGFGRLLRAADDRGVVIVLDRRLASSRYSARFLNSLPSGLRVEGDPFAAIKRMLS